MTHQWWGKLFNQKYQTSARRTSAYHKLKTDFKPRVENLEPRWVPSTMLPSNAVVTITNPGTQHANEGDAANLQILASDSLGQPLTYTATGLPSDVSINSTSGLISGTFGPQDAGVYPVTVAASDGVHSNSVTF